MQAKEFNFSRYHDFYERTQKRLRDFETNRVRELMVSQHPACEFYGALSNSKETSLEAQLDSLTAAMDLHSDFAFNYLEPWHGVGIYAAAFGSPVIRTNHTAIQTLYRYQSIDDLEENIAYPDYSKCEYLTMVLDTIRYFKEQTGGEIPICLTDTQSPNDTASLILDACELFAASISEPELLQDLLGKVTRLITEFTERQIEEIGEGNVAYYGHQMYSDPSFRGISLSDDNVAVVSPRSFRNSSLDYLKELSLHFDGLALHSCGRFTHSLPDILEIPKLKVLECAVGFGDPGFPSDPNPNEAEKLREYFLDRDISLKVRLGPNELERVFPLLDRRIKLQIQLVTHGSIDEKNRQYDRAKEILLAHYK